MCVVDDDSYNISTCIGLMEKKNYYKYKISLTFCLKLNSGRVNLVVF